MRIGLSFFIAFSAAVISGVVANEGAPAAPSELISASAKLVASGTPTMNSQPSEFQQPGTSEWKHKGLMKGALITSIATGIASNIIGIGIMRQAWKELAAAEAAAHHGLDDNLYLLKNIK